MGNRHSFLLYLLRCPFLRIDRTGEVGNLNLLGSQPSLAKSGQVPTTPAPTVHTNSEGSQRAGTVDTSEKGQARDGNFTAVSWRELRGSQTCRWTLRAVSVGMCARARALLGMKCGGIAPRVGLRDTFTSNIPLPRSGLSAGNLSTALRDLTGAMSLHLVLCSSRAGIQI